MVLGPAALSNAIDLLSASPDEKFGQQAVHAFIVGQNVKNRASELLRST